MNCIRRSIFTDTEDTIVKSLSNPGKRPPILSLIFCWPFPLMLSRRMFPYMIELTVTVSLGFPCSPPCQVIANLEFSCTEKVLGFY